MNKKYLRVSGVNKKYLLAGGVVVVLLLTLFALDSSSQKVTGEATSSADTKYYYCCETSSGIYWQDSCNTAAGYIRLGLNANCLDWSWKSCATVCANKFAGSTPSQDDTEKACKCTKTASTPPDTTSSDITKKYYCCKITSGGSSKVEWTDLCGGTGREILALDTNCLKWTYKSCDALCAKKVPESSIIGTSERVGASCLCRWSTGTRSGSGTSPATDSGSQQFYCCHTGIGSAPAEKAMEWIEYCSTTAGHRRLNLARYCLIGTYKSCSAFCSAKRPGSTGSKVGESCVCTGGTYSAVTEISECTIINTPGRYRLKNSITYSGDYSCMTIRADDVELDCQGPNGPYEIKRPITGTEKKGVGVNIVGDTSSLGSGIMCRKGVVVKNCKIKGFKSGVSFDHTAEDKATGRNTEYMATITKNQITGNTRGIALATWWPKFVNIYRNDIRNNDWGLYLEDTTSHTIHGNTVVKNNYGIYLKHSTYNSIQDNMVGNTEEYNYGVGISLNDRSKENSIKWNYATCTGPPGVACADKGAYFDYSCADSNYVNLQGNGFGNTKETDCEYVDEADSSTRSGDSSGGGGASDDSSTRTVEVYVGNFYCCHKWAGFSGKGYHWKKSCPNKWNWNRNKYHECDKHESCSAFCDSKKGDGVASRSEILTSGKDRCRCYSIEER